jgi:hypothetical protein
LDIDTHVFIWGYLVLGLGGFFFLLQYKPDTSAETWGRNEALKRMKLRGVDLEKFKFDPSYLPKNTDK